MTLPVFIIDTFTSVKFKGNPTAVCVIEKELAYEEMLSIAKELNLPVTAFIQKENAAYKIKYFTTTTEIPACGHATLASAKVVFDNASITTATFKTIDHISIETKLNNDVIEMCYPKYNIVSFIPPALLLKSLGLQNYKSAGFCKELETLFIETDNAKLLQSLQPDYKTLTESSDTIKEVVVTSIADDIKYDFLLRSFCPWIGIDEDPVTGSVHSVLAHFWKERLGKTTLTAYQASERGGEVYVTALENTVALGGKAIIVVKGDLTI